MTGSKTVTGDSTVGETLKRRTRVLLLIPTLDQSGAEKQFTLLATGLDPNEFSVRVVALTRGGPYMESLLAAGIHVSILHKRFRIDPIALYRLRREIEGFDPQVVHSWLFAANAAVRLVCRPNTQRKIVVSERCVDSWKAGWQTWLDKRLISKTSCLLANSQAVAEFYKKLGYPENKVRCIPNGIDAQPRATTGRSAEAAELRNSIVQRFRIPPENAIVVYVGRLAAQKRVADLIWAVELMKNLDTPVSLLLLGDGPARKDLERHVASITGLADNVHFVGHEPHARRWLQAADVFWLASEFEGMSNSLMEAMAAGLPCVVSDIPANAELVQHDHNGYRFPVGDSLAVAQLTRQILSDPQLGNRLGSAAHKTMLDGFSIPMMIQRHTELYRELAGTHGSA